MIPVRNIEEKFFQISEYWKPKILAEVNGQFVKLAKLKGEFVWHNHSQEDELFYIVKGQLEIQIEGQESLILSEGDMSIIPKGISHKPIAQKEVWVMLIEPVSTKHTGDIVSELTHDDLEWID